MIIDLTVNILFAKTFWISCNIISVTNDCVRCRRPRPSFDYHELCTQYICNVASAIESTNIKRTVAVSAHIISHSLSWLGQKCTRVCKWESLQ